MKSHAHLSSGTGRSDIVAVMVPYTEIALREALKGAWEMGPGGKALAGVVWRH